MKGVKKAAIIALVAITVAACTMKKQAESEVSQAQLLDERLTTLQQKGYMSGHQDDPFYGVEWAYEDGKSDVLLSVGDYPAVMGFELGGIEMGEEKMPSTIRCGRSIARRMTQQSPPASLSTVPISWYTVWWFRLHSRLTSTATRSSSSCAYGARQTSTASTSDRVRPFWCLRARTCSTSSEMQPS